MTDEYTTLPHERLDGLFAWISVQKSEGRSDEAIVADLKAIDEMFYEKAVADAVAAGQDEATVRAFFEQMGVVGDHEPGDAIDEGDPDYNADHGY